MSDTKKTQDTEQTDTTSPQEVADKNAELMLEYNRLCPKLTAVCEGTTAKVAIAACVSAAATVCLGTMRNEIEARNYLLACFNDILRQLPEKFAEKDAANAQIERPN